MDAIESLKAQDAKEKKNALDKASTNEKTEDSVTTPTKAIPLTEDIDNKEFAACVGIPATIVSDHEEMFKSLRIKAMRLARTHVKIETMPSSESKLVAMLQETVLPHIKAKSDEVRTEYLTVYYDVRDSGETATAPHLRYTSYSSYH